MTSGRVQLARSDMGPRGGIERLPIATLFAFAAGMTLVCLYAVLNGEARTVMTFAYGAVGCAILGASLSMILRGRLDGVRRGGLIILLGFYAIGPAVAAIPLYDLRSVPDFSAAYFEMASALTTTGATMFWNIDDVPQSVLLWRSMCAGFGGYVCFVAALAILAPLSIGGFEVEHTIDRRAETTNYAFLCASEGARVRRLEDRVFWAARLILIPYLSVAFVCWFALAASGAPAFDALCLALGAVSTTGFTATSGGVAGYDSLAMEIVLVCTMIPAAIGISAHLAAFRNGGGLYLRNPELRYMLIAAGSVVAILFFRHWIGAIETRSADEVVAGFQALWGSIFMAVSFVTTTGFESADWDGATAWSGLRTPGVALMGLAIIGGGAASTAGGVKLIRAALLAKHSLGELRRLARPSSVQPIFSGGRTISFDALRIVWVFVMLYGLALAAVALGLTATGMQMIQSVSAAVAAMSNTGPVLPLILGEQGGSYTTLTPVARFILCAGMIVGRMETLAVVALVSVTAWRR